MKKNQKTRESKSKEGTPKLFLWKKVGRGTLSFLGKTYKEGDKFSATEAEIPKAFRDLVVKIDEEGKTTMTPQMIRLKGGKYDVINKRGRKVNDSPLSKEDAEDLLATL